MLPVRLAFDATLPFRTTAAFSCGERTFAPDEPFPWKDLGITELELNALWRSAMVTCVAEPATVTFVATPGERVDVSQDRKRSKRS